MRRYVTAASSLLSTLLLIACIPSARAQAYPAQSECRIRVDVRFYMQRDVHVSVRRDSALGDAVGNAVPDSPAQEVLYSAIHNALGKAEWEEIAKKKYPFVCLSDNEHPAADYLVFWTLLPSFARGLLLHMRASGCALMPPWAGDVEPPTAGQKLGKDPEKRVFLKLMEDIAKQADLPDPPGNDCLAPTEVQEGLERMSEADWEHASAERDQQHRDNSSLEPSK